MAMDKKVHKRMKTKRADALMNVFERLLGHFGPRHWWPGETPLEVMVGAVLTQNTAWKNVAKAIAALKQADALDVTILYEMDDDLLAQLIRSAGYFNVKASRLKNLMSFVMEESGGDLRTLFSTDMDGLRQKLLAVKGVGPETADSILLYAGQLPSFVVDAYTIRVLSRHGLAGKDSSYEDVRRLFMKNLPEDVSLYNEFHALLVAVGHHFCRKTNPLCGGCPLESLNNLKRRSAAEVTASRRKR